MEYFLHVLNIRSFSFCLFPQLVSIITDETPIEQMRNRLVIRDRGSSSSSSTPSSQLPHHPPHTRKPKLALLREVFGRGGFVLVIYDKLKRTPYSYFHQTVDNVFD